MNCERSTLGFRRLKPSWTGLQYSLLLLWLDVALE
jgi:hypothetical protein